MPLLEGRRSPLSAQAEDRLTRGLRRSAAVEPARRLILTCLVKSLTLRINGRLLM